MNSCIVDKGDIMTYERQEMHAIVFGRVQGVGFRYTTRHLAMALGVEGAVKNLPDGSVEIYAQGPKALLEELIDALNKEMGGRYITEIKKSFYDPSKIMEGFKIVF